MKRSVVMEINNAPEYAFEYRYMVVTIVDGEAWFYGAWNSREYAEAAVKESEYERLIIETGANGQK